MQYFVIIVSTLIGLFGLRYTATDKVGKISKVTLMILLMVGGGYSIYQTHYDKQFLEPWQTTRLVYDKVLDLKIRLDALQVSGDTASMEKLLKEAQDIAIFAEVNKAPESVRSKITLFIITEQLLVLSAIYPKYSISDLLNEAMKNHYFGGAEGMTGGQALNKFGYFRVEDFGPPYYVLSGIDNNGNPIVVENRLIKEFFQSRARDILRDFMLETQ